MVRRKWSKHSFAFPVLAALAFGSAGTAGGDRALTAEHSGGGLQAASVPLLETPLKREVCDPFFGLFKGSVSGSFAGSRCQPLPAEAGSMLEKLRREQGLTGTTPDEPTNAEGDHAPRAIDESVIRDVVNKRSYEKISPVDATNGQTLDAVPRMLQLMEQCGGHPALPDIVQRSDPVRGDGLRGVAFDLRLDRLTVRSRSGRVEVRTLGGLALYDLGRAGSDERLYALKAGTYAEEKPSEGSRLKVTDPRIASGGVLHLFFIPSCRYAGGIVFPSRARVGMTFYRSKRYEGANPDGTDLVRKKWAILKNGGYHSTSPILADLIRIAGVDDRVFFVTAWPDKISRSVILHRGWTDDLNEALRGGYDSYGGLKDDIEGRLRRAGLPFEVLDEEPKYNAEIWEIQEAGGEARLARWRPDPRKKYTQEELLQFSPAKPLTNE